jgi:uncharacterized protein with von Willebrand factor type A (vWA) domain
MLSDIGSAVDHEMALTIAESRGDFSGPVSDTVLRVDRWGRRRGVELTDEWQRLETACAEGSEEGEEAEGSEDEASQALKTGPIDPTVAADAHASLFEPGPELAERPKDAARAAWWRQLMETPEYGSLRSQTVLNASLSGLASKALCDQWTQYAATQEPERPDCGDGKPGGKPAPGSDGESIADQVARIRSTGKALAEAAETVSTANDMAAGLGMGAGGSTLDQAKLAEYFRRVRSDSTLRKILEFAGKAIRRCRALQRTKVTASRGELTGIELGGDVARLVPWEMAQVSGAVPELEMLALHRLAQRRSLCYRQRRSEPLASGPIVIVTDQSGSMCGQKAIAAKGIALAMAWLARQQKRWCALIAYSGETGHSLLPMPPQGADQGPLIDWLEAFIGGGSNLDLPIQEMPEFHREIGAPKGRTDIIMITDAIVHPGEHAEPYRAWAKSENVTSYGIVVGASDAGECGVVFDRYWTIPELSLDSHAVEEVLSI